jgi:hypothetical protein
MDLTFIVLFPPVMDDRWRISRGAVQTANMSAIGTP